MTRSALDDAAMSAQWSHALADERYISLVNLLFGIADPGHTGSAALRATLPLNTDHCSGSENDDARLPA